MIKKRRNPFKELNKLRIFGLTLPAFGAIILGSLLAWRINWVLNYVAEKGISLFGVTNPLVQTLIIIVIIVIILLMGIGFSGVKIFKLIYGKRR